MALNSTQKNILDGTLRFVIDTCLENGPEIGLIAFKSMLSNSLWEQLQNSELWCTVQKVREILSHEYPQNRSVGDPTAIGNRSDGVMEGYVYYWILNGSESSRAREPQGMLSLTAKNDGVTSPVTQKDVETYIKHKIYMEIYKLTHLFKKTGWILHTLEKIDLHSYNLECEDCKISIVAPERLSKKSDAAIAHDNIQTTITATVKNPEKIALITKRLQDEKPSIKLRSPGEGNSSSVEVNIKIGKDNTGYIDIGTHFKGNDPAMGTLLNVFNQFIFSGEIPLFLLNFLREAVGQELIEYQPHLPYEENVGNSQQRINKISEAIGSQKSAITTLIGEYDYPNTNEGLVYIEEQKETMLEHWQRHEFDKMVPYAKRAATLGDRTALATLYSLAELYALGKDGVPQDLKLATQLFQLCASLGHKKASGYLHHIGFMYFTGDGIHQDIARAAELFQQTAALGLPEAYFNLGILSQRTVPSDFKRSSEYFMQALQLGNKEAIGALVNIGKRYFNGIGVTKNVAQAIALFKQGDVLGDEDAKCWLGVAFFEGKGVTKDLEHAVSLFKQAADLGSKEALNNLVVIARLYLQGNEDVQQDLEYAIALLRYAMEMGDTNGMIELGIVHALGKGVPKDLRHAAVLFKKAGDLGNTRAGNNLTAIGFKFFEGTEVPWDMEYAIGLFKQAATLGDKNSLDNLYSSGRMYYRGYNYNGHRVTQNVTRAIELFHFAADLEHSGAIYNFAVVCMNGEGIPRDLERSAKLFKQAADLGHKDSIDALNLLGIWYFEGKKVQQNLKRAGELFQQAMQLGLPEAGKNYKLVCSHQEQKHVTRRLAAQDIRAASAVPAASSARINPVPVQLVRGFQMTQTVIRSRSTSASTSTSARNQGVKSKKETNPKKWKY